jgi:cell division protein FtsI/penicillin-binding protein 2
VEDLYGNRRGALGRMDPKTGEILAFVSKPTFDPNLFVDGIDVENWQALNESIDKPLLNRALRGTYPPGSTFKPFMALAALETGKRTPEQAISDPATSGSATTSSATTRKAATARSTCTAPSCSRATPTTTCWPTTWAWT